MSASIRDRLIVLALYHMASATPEADEAHPQSHSNANPISLLERLYRLRLVSAGILCEADKTVRPRLHIKRIWLHLAPDVFEPPRRQRRIARGRVVRAVTEIGLQRSRIDALIGRRVAAGMPQHVRVYLEADLGFGARRGRAAWRSPTGERATTLRGEDKGRGGSALQLP
jgi:hypothetical protein